MYYDNKDQVVILVVHFKLRSLYDITWSPINTFGWNSLLNHVNKELVVLLVVHFELRRYYGIIVSQNNNFVGGPIGIMTIKSWGPLVGSFGIKKYYGKVFE